VRVRAWVLPLFFAISLAAVTFLFMDRYIAGISLPSLSFWSHRKESAYTVAEEIGDLYFLNTSEYRLKLIFPHDFVDRDLSWWAVKEMYERGFEGDENQQKLVEVYRACLDVGIDPAVDVYDFIILTAVVKAGINISGTVFENPSRYRDGLDSYVRIKGEGVEKSLSLHLPPSQITELYIEDRKPSEDNFPDAKLTPGQWRDLVSFLQPGIREKVIRLGILKDADENGRALVGKILKDSGFAEVYFRERKL